MKLIDLLLVVTETAKLTLVVAPNLLHLHKELQEYLLLQETLHILTCLLADLLQTLALVTDYDALL